MKTRILVAVAAIVAFAVAGSLSPVRGAPQQDVPKKGKIHPTSQDPSEKKIQYHSNEPGRSDDEIIADHMSAMARVDSVMQRMTMLRDRARSYSKSFASLAEAHHGADKREILMMQRMSDSMGTMAEEIRVSLQQYKNTLENETASESGNMKAEVQNFQAILDGMATHVEQAVNTLQTLEEQLGQG